MAPVVQIESRGISEVELLGQRFPPRRQLLRAPNDPRDVAGIVRAADVRAGIAEAAEHRDRAGGPLQRARSPPSFAVASWRTVSSSAGETQQPGGWPVAIRSAALGPST